MREGLQETLMMCHPPINGPAPRVQSSRGQGIRIPWIHRAAGTTQLG